MIAFCRALLPAATSHVPQGSRRSTRAASASIRRDQLSGSRPSRAPTALRQGPRTPASRGLEPRTPDRALAAASPSSRYHALSARVQRWPYQAAQTEPLLTAAAVSTWAAPRRLAASPRSRRRSRGIRYRWVVQRSATPTNSDGVPSLHHPSAAMRGFGEAWSAGDLKSHNYFFANWVITTLASSLVPPITYVYNLSKKTCQKVRTYMQVQLGTMADRGKRAHSRKTSNRMCVCLLIVVSERRRRRHQSPRLRPRPSPRQPPKIRRLDHPSCLLDLSSLYRKPS